MNEFEPIVETISWWLWREVDYWFGYYSAIALRLMVGTVILAPFGLAMLAFSRSEYAARLGERIWVWIMIFVGLLVVGFLFALEVWVFYQTGHPRWLRLFLSTSYE